LSHHLDKLRNEGLVDVQREGTYLRYRANIGALQELLTFLYSECCTRSKAINPNNFVKACRSARSGETVEFRKAVKPR